MRNNGRCSCDPSPANPKLPKVVWNTPESPEGPDHGGSQTHWLKSHIPWLLQLLGQEDILKVQTWENPSAKCHDAQKTQGKGLLNVTANQQNASGFGKKYRALERLKYCRVFFLSKRFDTEEFYVRHSEENLLLLWSTAARPKTLKNPNPIKYPSWSFVLAVDQFDPKQFAKHDYQNQSKALQDRGLKNIQIFTCSASLQPPQEKAQANLSKLFSPLLPQTKPLSLPHQRPLLLPRWSDRTRGRRRCPRNRHDLVFQTRVWKKRYMGGTISKIRSNISYLKDTPSDVFKYIYNIGVESNKQND